MTTALVIASGVYLIGFAFIMNTKNLISALSFRVIPGFIGVGNLIAGLKLAGVL